jgi:hypothetical protein
MRCFSAFGYTKAGRKTGRQDVRQDGTAGWHANRLGGRQAEGQQSKEKSVNYIERS